MTSTYTSNPPSNATAFKAWLERTEPGTPTWRNCRYLVWGLGNSQWNAFLAFPRYVHKKLSDLGATPLADFAYGDVGSPVWERLHADWNAPRLAGPARAVRGAADRGRGGARRRRAGGRGRADGHRLDHRDAQVAARRRGGAAPQPVGRATSVSSIMRLMSPGRRRDSSGPARAGAGASRGCCSPRRS